MVFGVIADVLLAVFAVFGFYAALRVAMAYFASPANLSLALEIDSKEDAENAECLLAAARESFFPRKNNTLLVLLNESFSSDTELIGRLSAKNATIRFVGKGGAGDAGGCEKCAGNAERKR